MALMRDLTVMIFEDKTTGEVPSSWGTNVNYSQSEADSDNTLQHSDVFQVVDTISHSGSKPLYVRSSEYIGNRADELMNHNHFLAVSDGDTWYCVEASFDNTGEQYSEKKNWLDDELIV